LKGLIKLKNNVYGKLFIKTKESLESVQFFYEG
jgi:hypothetical protein